MAIKYTEEQLNSVDKSMLIQMFLNQQEQLEKVSANLHSLDTKMQAMMEQLIIGNKNRFGRSSEKMEDTQQMRFIEVDGTLVFFNEAEAVCDLDAPEPETLEATPERKKKTKGKKAQDMSELSTNRIDHYMTEEELTAEFGENGWKQLPDAIARRYRFIPAKVEVDEHHVGVYASKTDGHMVKAKHPKSLLHGSPVSASLAAAIMNGKYVNAVPLYRLEQEFIRYGLAITRQNMANWMIRLGEEYLSVLYDHLHSLLYGYHVIQADETPVLVNRDGRSAGSKSYMWVYRSGLLWSSFFVTLVAKKIVLINLCCRPCFIWGSITIITVWTNMIIINVCKFFYLLIECFLCCKLIQICAFILQGIEITLHRCIVVRISCFAHALCHIYRFAEFGKCFGRIL